MRKQQGPIDLNGPNAALLLQEERDENRRLQHKEIDEENRADFWVAQRAVDEGHENTDTRGKRIRGRGRNVLVSAIHPASAQNERNNTGGIIPIAAAGITMAELAGYLQAVYAGVSKIIVPPAPSVTIAKPQFEDTAHIFGEIQVSRATAKKLQEELAEIEGITQQMAALDADIDPFAPWKENDLWDQRKILLDDYKMCALPDKSGFAHSHERVLELECAVNPMAIAQHATVLVYVQKADTKDSLGVSVKVGDVLDNDPAEMIASGDHLKGQPAAQPIPPPEMHHV